MTRFDESYICGQISRELARIRREAPDAETVWREWRIADTKYRDHVADGRGDYANGCAILGYYAARQAYFMYAQERGFSLEVS